MSGSSNLCAGCNVKCQTCFGPNENQCTSCRTLDDTTTHNYLQYGTTTCVTACPDGQYANVTSHLCHLCDSNCAKCDTNSVNCLTCDMDGGAEVFLEGTVCVEICQIGYYGRSSDNQCIVCEDGCASCDGPDLTDCFTCRTADDTTT